MNVLISGAGIAGSTLAYWLRHYGIQSTIIEKAPKLRTSGYIIDFWGLGFEVADRMSLMPELRQKAYVVQEVRVVDGKGKRIAGFPVKAFSRLTRDRYISLPRGDLAAAIYGRIHGDVETILGDSISRIDERKSNVRVGFESGKERDFDLVVGADGLHSRVRQLAFGPEREFEKHLGYQVAAFEIDGYPHRDELVYIMYTEIGQQVARFTMRDNRTMFLLSFADDDSDAAFLADTRAQKALLRKRFANSRWETPQILDALDTVTDLYFDRVSQILMDTGDGCWTRGRVTLVGDAAFCVSLLAGQGSALAMAAAYILAGELHRSDGNYSRAFSRYQDIFGPLVAAKQKSALRFAGLIAPKSQVSLFLRNQMMNLMRIPWISELSFANDVRDDLELPEYEEEPLRGAGDAAVDMGEMH